MTQTFGLKLGSDQKIAKFLKLTVEITRKTLKCDRVIIYSASQSTTGLVLAESVEQEYPSVLGKTIKDPFLKGRYHEMYSYGMPVAIDDIGLTDRSKSELKDLEQFGVKSLMMAPIVIDNKLLALLVAHQCSQIKLWHHEAVIFLTEKANATGLALSQKPSITNGANADNIKQLPPNNYEQEVKTTQQLENNDQIIQFNQNKHKAIVESEPSSSLSILQAERQNETEQANVLSRKVEEIRRILNCDRMIIYSLNPDNYGKITSESVAFGWLKVQGKIIEDPCLASQYLDQYRSGKSQTINNIYQSDLSQEYIKQLEQLEAKACLVAPIINERRLFGLLCAHQCSNPRQWEQTEIFWLAQIAKQVGFILDNTELLANAKRLRQQAADESKWTEHFTNAIQKIRQSLNTQDILNNSVEVVRQTLKCDRVVVYGINPNNSGIIVAESVTNDWIKAKGKVIDELGFESQDQQQYLTGKVQAINNIYQSNLTPRYIEQLEKLQVKANLAAPILNEGKLFGLLVAHQCNNNRQWEQTEIRWVAQISAQIGFALENAKVIKQLEKSAEANKELVQRKYKQIENLKQAIVDVLGKNGYAYQSLSQEAMGQSEITINVLSQIKKTADSLNAIALNIKQIQFQGQQNELAAQTTQQSLERGVKNLSNAQGTVDNVAMGLEDFSNSCQEIFQTVKTVKDLSKQIVQKSMNIARAINSNQIPDSEQDSIVSSSDAIFALMQQLFETTAKVELQFANTQSEINNKAAILDSGKQQLISGIGEFQSITPKIDQLVTVNQQMTSSLENTSQSLENQIQSSNFANDSIQDVVDVAEKISEQSMIITESFQQLVELVQQL
ncbi:MAG: GAF domain-containing protein [Xenococcaceae cyanobacterium MO_188.B19]|nr:GAF domain-containing protein [Xenococcaceae cyanobacterium MO_188.B19]